MTRRILIQGQKEVIKDKRYLGTYKRLKDNVILLKDYYGLSWAEVAIRTGYSQEHLNNVFLRQESVGTPCSLDLLVKISEVLETSPGKLLDIDLGIKGTIEERLLGRKSRKEQ